MGLSSLQQALRDLPHCRSAAGSVLRVCALVLLAQITLMTIRAPFGHRSAASTTGHSLPHINTDTTIAWRNGSLVNGKALLSLLCDVLQTAGQHAGRQLAPLAAARQLLSPPAGRLLRQLSDQQLLAVRGALSAVLADSDSGDEPLPPSRYRADVQRVVLFDQWLPAGELSVWVSPLSDSSGELAAGRLDGATLAACVTYRGHPHLGVVVHPFTDTLVWGLYARGNSLNLRVADPMRYFPERFGIAIDNDNSSQLLALRAFFSDADVISSGSVPHQLLDVVSGFTDAALYAADVPLRALCAPHALLRLYGGRLTDLRGEELRYVSERREEAAGERREVASGGLLAALFYHKQLLDQVAAAREGRVPVRIAYV